VAHAAIQQWKINRMIKIWVETDVSEFTWFLLLPRRNDTPERKKARKRYLTRLEKLKLASGQRFVFFQGILVEDDPRGKREADIFNLVRVLRELTALRAAQSVTEHFGWSHVVSRQNVVTISKDQAEVLRVIRPAILTP
jgi:hypothetical protein